jgi:hypothetical protein
MQFSAELGGLTMNDESNNLSNEISLRDEVGLYVAFAWLAILSASFALWSCIN